MASYLIKKDSNTGEIMILNYDLDGYRFRPNIRNEKVLKINEVTIIKPSMIEHVLAIKFDKTFRKLAQAVLYLLETEDDETSDDEIMLALDEITRMRSILEHKYHKFLSAKKEKEFLTKLYYLEKELKYKLLLIRERLQLSNNEKSRSL